MSNASPYLPTEQTVTQSSPEIVGLERQRKLADLLTAQAFQQQPQGQMISGHYVAPSWTQQLNPMANILAGNAISQRADIKQAELAAALRGKGIEETKAIIELAKKNPDAALALASNAETAQGKAFAPGLMQNLTPKTPEDVAKFKYAQTPEGGNYKGTYEEFVNRPNDYQKQQLINEQKRIAIDQARLANDKAKTEINPVEGQLRTSFLGQIQPHVQISQAYRKIESAPTTAAGDMSRIFGYMKILDPGSTVREGEYASAENARGVPDTVRAQYNRVMSGQRLTDKQRNEFTQAAGDLVTSQKVQFETQKKYYSDIAQNYRINDQNIIYDPYKDLDIKTTPKKEPKQATNANQQLNIPKVNTGVTFLGFEK